MQHNPDMQPPMSPLREYASRRSVLDRVVGALRGLVRCGRAAARIGDPAALRNFLYTRTNFVAQMTLYGYLRTRAGTRYPELFENDRFVASTNIAKWHVWLACLSDLAVYTGGMLCRNSGASNVQVSRLMRRLIDEILAEAGTPEEAGVEYAPHAERVRTRIMHCDWSAQADGEAAFVASPSALVHWAPIVDELKALDEEIVRNSVRFRWKEIREQLRQALDAESVIAAAEPGPQAGADGRTTAGG